MSKFEIIFGENTRINVRWDYVRKTVEFPLGQYFAVMGFVRLKIDFEEVIRVDNAPHKGEIGTHIHYLDKPLRKGKEVIEDAKDILHYMEAYDIVFNYLSKNYEHLMA